MGRAPLQVAANRASLVPPRGLRDGEGETGMQIRGTAALVTGGASGLGAATARLLAREGGKVAVLDRNQAAGKSLAGEIGGVFCACDVTEPASVEAAIAQAASAHGPARILINCAGIGAAARIVGRDGPMALDAFERVVRVNLIGTFNVMRLAAAAMTALPETEAGERGVIVAAASVAAYDGQIGQAAYAASKGGIVSLILPAARELARFGIRVLAIAPGLFRTPLLEDLPPDTQTALAAAIPFPARLGDPQEFAALVAAMIANTYLNGEVVRLDGALRMAPK
jgi:NAD(P)-dependent dehydrogenase (short-subunit alcohol dehydrogenase family)